MAFFILENFRNKELVKVSRYDFAIKTETKNVREGGIFFADILIIKGPSSV